MVRCLGCYFYHALSFDIFAFRSFAFALHPLEASGPLAYSIKTPKRFAGGRCCLQVSGRDIRGYLN